MNNESIAIYLKKFIISCWREQQKILRSNDRIPDDDFDKTTLEVRGLHLLSGLLVSNFDIGKLEKPWLIHLAKLLKLSKEL